MESSYTLQKSHAYSQFEILRSKKIDGAGAQVSYNVPSEIVTELIKDGVLILKDDNEQGKDYYLKDSIRFNLSKNIIKLIGENYNNKNNIFFIRWAKSNNKPQLIKAAYKNKGNGYQWFVDLYDKNGIGNVLIFRFDEISKELNLDVQFNYNEKIVEVDEMPNSDDMNFVIEAKKKIPNNPRNGGDNVIYYGAPGCGKSHKVKSDLSSVPEENKFRVTFHPEYTNSDFVGQILPRIEKDSDNKDVVKYVFNPGPFTKVLERALTTEDPVFLVIEEINRGNAAAIFGDLFQLLDRQRSRNDDGTENPDFGRSEYEITNLNIEDYLKENIDLPKNFKIYIPRNMRIRATMNSSDQNVFTLDTAFKRRWDFEQISNEFDDYDKKKFKNLCIPGTEVGWQKFLEILNPEILKYKIRNNTNEDKQLGKYFINEDCLTNGFVDIKDCQEQASRFAYKVLEYLWNDVCKIDKDMWFDTNKYQTLEQLIGGFKKPELNQNPLSVFKGIDFTK